MNLRRFACTSCLTLLLAAMASGETALKPEVDDVAVPRQAPKDAAPAMTSPSRAQCVARCEASNGECNSEVRRDRQACSKQAATGGNNPFTGRPNGRDMYCGYFNRDHCGLMGNRGACSDRFARRYAECVEWMRGNVASNRFDCVRAETKAQALCRAELRDCKATCE